ncbi:MAG: class I SAM-dependent methyltransferase [Actinomycetota bacterium]|nr:class I SAM-dependent methyltransferase [Actinomycetota bacterium]
MRRRGADPENLALREGERWKPPIFAPLDGRRARLMAVVRRFFDLQAGSLWLHLAPVLSRAMGTVVDVGCGAQPYRGLLPEGTRYIGLDIEQALERFGYELAGARAISSDGRWPLEDGEADLVLATETLEHVPEPVAFLERAFRALRPGGRVIITTPFAARWHYIPHDYWRFTPSSLRLLLKRAGFEDVVVYGRGNETTVACYKVLALLLPRVLPQEADGTPRLRPLGLLLLPLILPLTVVANCSLRSPAGDDCLGYTTFARRPSAH